MELILQGGKISFDEFVNWKFNLKFFIKLYLHLFESGAVIMSNHQEKSGQDNLVTASARENKGHLKIFIGYAPGVGKTYTMLSEGNRRLKYGEDIVIGFVEPHHRPETTKQIGSLDVIPCKKVTYNKVEYEEMDTEEIITRMPQTVLVDELAHTNAPGMKNKKRFEDVQEILSHGINVVTTLNIQHIESLNDIVKQITGSKVKETIPDYIVKNANEVVMVDLTPDALQNRLMRGNIYEAEKVPQALNSFFKKGNLNALRELALRETAEEVDEDLIQCMKNEGIKDTWQAVERVMVCASPSPGAKKLIRRGARVAERYKCEWYVVFVNCTNRFAKKVSLKDKQLLHTHEKLTKDFGGEVVVLTGKSVSEELYKFANEHHITQIIIGHPTRSWFETILRGSTVNKLIKRLSQVEIHLIPSDRHK